MRNALEQKILKSYIEEQDGRLERLLRIVAESFNYWGMKAVRASYEHENDADMREEHYKAQAALGAVSDLLRDVDCVVGFKVRYDTDTYTVPSEYGAPVELSYTKASFDWE